MRAKPGPQNLDREHENEVSSLVLNMAAGTVSTFAVFVDFFDTVYGDSIDFRRYSSL